MNYRGSFRKLLGNAKSAMMGAIEIYNKPAFDYRDECFVILLLNAWELALKALLSKNHESIFYPKKRKEPYRTLSCRDALNKAAQFFPKSLPHLPVKRNLDLLSTYRDNAVHFYNEPGFGVLIYALAQTSIINFKDLLSDSFGVRLEESINWHLLPLGIKPPIDPVSYIAGDGGVSKPRSKAVQHFLSELVSATDEIKGAGQDTGRLLTIFRVKLESLKKIGDPDVVVGVEKSEGTGPLAILRTQDPNITHPLRTKDVIANIGELHGRPFTSHTFQALAWHLGIKENPQYCWRAKVGGLTMYSNDVIPVVKRLSPSDVDRALSKYREHHRPTRLKALRSRRGQSLES